MKRLQGISAKLERLAHDYRNDMELAIDNLNDELEGNLTQLVEDYGAEAVKAAVETIEDNLSIDSEQRLSLLEALGGVSDFEHDEELQGS